MINQPATSEPGGSYSFVEGTEVFDVNGEKVGTVIAPNPQSEGCLVIQKGWLFANELYVPFSYVVSQDSRGIFLNLSKDELKDERWKVPPAASKMVAAANAPMAAGSQMGSGDPAAATDFPPMESPKQEPAPPVTPEPMSASLKDHEEPLSTPPRERVERDDEWTIADRGTSEDEQPVDVVLVPDASDAETDQSDQSDGDPNVSEQSLQDEQFVDMEMVPDASDAEADQSSQSDTDLNSGAQLLPGEQFVHRDGAPGAADTETDQSSESDDDLNVREQSLPDEQPIGVVVVPDTSDAEADQSSESDDDLNDGELPLQTMEAGAHWSKQSNELEQRVLDRMEGAAAGVTAATPEENRSGVALRVALLVGFDAALKQNAARQLSEQGPRGSADPIASLLARVGPAEIPELAPLLAAAWRAALAVTADNPSRAPQVRRTLEQLARD